MVQHSWDTALQGTIKVRAGQQAPDQCYPAVIISHLSMAARSKSTCPAFNTRTRGLSDMGSPCNLHERLQESYL